MPKDESPKEIAVAAAAAVIALAENAEPLTAIVTGTFALAFEQIAARHEKRARKVLTDLFESDASPHELAASVNARLAEADEEVITVLRQLLLSTAEAAEPAAIEPMALLARAQMRGSCDMWVARGGLRLLAEVDARELGALREMFAAAERARGFGNSALFHLGRTTDGKLDGLRAPGDSEPLIARGHARRLADLLRRHGLTIELSFTPGSRKEATWHSESELALPEPVVGQMRAALLLVASSR